MNPVWPKIPLREVIQEEREKIGSFDGDSLPVLGVTNIDGVTHTGIESSADKSNYFRLRPNRFVYNPYRINVGSLGLSSAEQDGIASPAYVVFGTNERLNSQFLLYFLKSAQGNQLINFHGNRGSVRSALRFTDLCKIEIPLPPLSEQRRIVARIDIIAANIREARNLREVTKENADQLLAAEETRIWNRRVFGDKKKLKDVTSFLARGRQSEQGPSAHFLIKTQHVQEGRYVPTTLTLAPHVSNKVKADAIVRDGDILIACSAAGCLGRVARYKEDGRTASTDTHVAIVRPNPMHVEPDYLYAYLKSAPGQFQLKSRERGDWQREKIGFRLTELNLNDLRQVPVPLLSIINQRRIVAELNELQSEVDTLKRYQAETASELDGLLPAILDHAFRGEL